MIASDPLMLTSTGGRHDEEEANRTDGRAGAGTQPVATAATCHSEAGGSRAMARVSSSPTTNRGGTEMKKRVRDTKRAERTERKALFARLARALSKTHVATGGQGPAWRKAVETVAGLAR